MNVIKDCPRVLLRKLLFTVLIGLACLIIGIAAVGIEGDTITLALSGIVFVFSMTKCAGLYNILAKQKYELLEGTCVSVRAKPLRKLLVVRIMDDSGALSTLHLTRQSRIKIGSRYRFYFKNSTDRISLGSEYFDAALSSGGFLGLEEISGEG